jgi:hypothetical protein
MSGLVSKFCATVGIFPQFGISRFIGRLSFRFSWNDGSVWRNAYWGADNITSVTRTFIGALPATGQWVRLEVAASVLGLEGKTLSGMAFDAYGGRVTWDRAGK